MQVSHFDRGRPLCAAPAQPETRILVASGFRLRLKAEATKALHVIALTWFGSGQYDAALERVVG